MSQDNTADVSSSNSDDEVLAEGDFWDIRISRLGRRMASTLKTEELSGIIKAFDKNSEDIVALFAMPYGLLLSGLRESYLQRDFVQALTKTKTFDWKNSNPENQQQVQLEMQKMWGDKTKGLLEEDTIRRLRLMFSHPVWARTMRVLFSSGLTAAWTALESALADTWIQSINLRPLQLGKNVSQKIASDRTASGTDHILSFSALARYDFNLAGRLGSVLSRKFDFTSLSGMRAAYTAAFNKDKTLLDIFGDPQLKRLQAYRHCIIHKAGIADEAFLQTASTSTAALGEPVPLNLSEVEAMINSGLNAAGGVIGFVDSWLSEHPA